MQTRTLAVVVPGRSEFDRVLSSMMLHHLDDDVKAVAAAEIHYALRPGGTLHIVDLGGPMTAHDGFMARRMLRSPHIVGSLGDARACALVTAPPISGDIVLRNIAGCQTLSRRSSTDQAPHSTMELGARPKPGNAIGHEWLCVRACTPSSAVGQIAGNTP